MTPGGPPGRPPGLLQRLYRPWLHRIERLGGNARWRGRPFITGRGRITIGEDFFLSSQPVQSHLVAVPGAVLDIADRVSISYGAAIMAHSVVSIGADTRIGPFVVIIDSDYHRPGDRDAAGSVAPVAIGAGVEIGARVTILRGARIGDGAKIASGSVVLGAVPAGASVSGVPARAAGRPQPSTARAQSFSP